MGTFPYAAELLWHQEKEVPMAGISGAQRGKPDHIKDFSLALSEDRRRAQCGGFRSIC
jgi:hypothetical protein